MPDGSTTVPRVSGQKDAAALGEVYGFLSATLQRPLSASMLGTIRSAEFVEALAAAGVELDEAFTSSPEAALLDRLAIDYTQLFHGPHRHIPPYESVQTTDDGGEINGPAASTVRDFFESSGFTFDPVCGELPDHIAVELEFMAELVRREASAMQSGDATAAECWKTRRREFFVAHIGVWGSKFGRAVHDQAETTFYKELGLLLVYLLEFDGAGLKTCLNVESEEQRND